MDHPATAHLLCLVTVEETSDAGLTCGRRDHVNPSYTQDVVEVRTASAVRVIALEVAFCNNLIIIKNSLSLQGESENTSSNSNINC